MTREEKIDKLKTIKLCITNLTATYDMGLEFTILTSIGGEVNIGNIGNWPIGIINVTPELISLKRKISQGEKISIKDLENVDQLSYLITYNSTPSDTRRRVDEDLISNVINELTSLLSKVELHNKKIYVYSTLESWDCELKLFESYEQLEDFILKQWGGDVVFYEDMDDKQLDYYYKAAEEEDFKNIMPCFSSDDEEDRDEESIK